MRDLLGNTLRPGSLLWWISKQLPLRVARIEEPSTVAINRQPQRTLLVLEITVPIDVQADGAETQLADFLCAVNPDAERIVEGMLDGRKLQ